MLGKYPVSRGVTQRIIIGVGSQPNIHRHAPDTGVGRAADQHGALVSRAAIDSSGIEILSQGGSHHQGGVGVVGVARIEIHIVSDPASNVGCPKPDMIV